MRDSKPKQCNQSHSANVLKLKENCQSSTDLRKNLSLYSHAEDPFAAAS